MKGKNHLLLTGITIASFYFSVFYILMGKDWSYLFSISNLDTSSLIMIQFFSFLIIMLGSIIPDADIDNTHSKILHSFFAPIGWTYRAIDFFLSTILGKKRGHRQLQHSVEGIMLSSLVFVTIIGIFLYFIGAFNLAILCIMYLSLIAGQFLHIIQDFLRDRIPVVSGIVYLLVLVIFNGVLLLIYYK